MEPGCPPPDALRRARHRLPELAVGILRILLHDTRALEPLLIAQFDATQIQHAILHRGEHFLSPARRVALIECRDDSQCEVQAGAAVADLCTGDERGTVVKPGRRRGTAGTLGDVLVDFALFVGSRAEPFHRSHDHLRVERLNPLPRKPHPIERPGRKVLHENITSLDELFQDFLARGALRVERDRALVVIEHREIQAVGIRDVAQLLARDVSGPRTLNLDHVSAKPGQQLSAGRPRLHVSEIENANAV